MSIMKYISLSLLLILGVGCSDMKSSPETEPTARSAQKDTKISTEVVINNLGEYGAMSRCVEGEYKPIVGGVDCYLRHGESMQLKVYSKTIGLPDKALIYQVTAHNGEKSHACDDLGKIERGFTATFVEIVQSEPSMEPIEVCTSVTAVGHNTTRAEFVVSEKPDGIFVEFRNLGEDWLDEDPYPDTTGEILVDFTKVPD